jgi:hypothetical protein
MSGIYRGRLTAQPIYLACALKIIMHTNYMYTKDHPQRTHRPFILPVPVAAPAPVAPPLDTGVRYSDLHVRMKVKVWWLDDWWYAQIVYKSARNGTVTVRFKGDDIATSGILPRMVKIIG